MIKGIEEWPFMERGFAFWISYEGSRVIYLLGNPAIWIPAFLSIPVFILYYCASLVVKKHIFIWDGHFSMIMNSTSVFVLAYSLHYLPFFAMTRELYIHHYLPALYFSILCFGGLFELFLYQWYKTQWYKGG